MLSKEETLALIHDLESDRIERTISTRENKIGEAVCAFSNDFPNHKKSGYILLGVNDNGQVAGIRFKDEDLQKIGNIRQNGNVLPRPAMIVSPVYSFLEGDVVVIEVLPSDIPPVRYDGRCWIRIGPRRAQASEVEERILSEKRVSTAKTFDEQACKGASLRDLSIELFKLIYLPQAIDRDTLLANHRDIKEQLASLRLYNLAFDCPTNAGILLLGIDPLLYLKGAYIQYVKFSGEDMTSEVMEEKQFSGALVSELKNIDDFIRVQVFKEKPVKNGTFKENHVYNYPWWSLRELVMNAIMHRDYASNAPTYIYEFTNRIEIINPGGLYGDVRPENFPDASDYRNPELAVALKLLGYVNFGIKNAQAELQKNGNPLAEFRLNLITKFAVKIPIHPFWK